MGYLFTSESVSEGHPDKVADQISDAVLDKLLAYDPSSKVACETLVTTGQVVLAGEVKTKAYIDLQRVAREVINKIGYTKSEYMFEGNSCGVFSAIHEQSPDINRGVEREDPMNQGAGDQGMMFGYATNETENYMPLSLDLAHKLLMVLADIRREGKVMTYLRPDSKSQVTIEYDDNRRPVRIDTIVVSTQHDEFIQPADNSQEAQLKADEEMLAQIRKDVIEILMPFGASQTLTAAEISILLERSTPSHIDQLAEVETSHESRHFSHRAMSIHAFSPCTQILRCLVKKPTRAATCSFAFLARRRMSSHRLQTPRPGLAFGQFASSKGSSPSSRV